MAAQNGAVDWDAPARVDEDRVAHAQLARIDLAHAPGATHGDRAREKVAPSRGSRGARGRTVMPSSTSATRTNSVMTRAVKNSPIAAAATIAMVIDSSIVMRRARRFSNASLKMGQPPTSKPTMPIRLTARIGSQIEPHRYGRG